VLILTDTTVVSLVQITEHLRQHDDYGKSLYTRSPGGEMHKAYLPLLVVDTNILFNSDDPIETWLDAVDEILPLKEIVLAIGVIPPWEQERTEVCLNQIAGLTEDIRELSFPDFCATWYYPAENKKIPGIAAQAEGRIRTVTNAHYARLADPAWQKENQTLLGAIEKGILCHHLDGMAISPQLGEMFRLLIDAAEEA